MQVVKRHLSHCLDSLNILLQPKLEPSQAFSKNPSPTSLSRALFLSPELFLAFSPQYPLSLLPLSPFLALPVQSDGWWSYPPTPHVSS